jgi:hypothetical protein
MIVHGHVPGAGDPARGGKAAIVTAGRQEVERGLDRIEGKPINTGYAPARDWERSGAGDGTGAAPITTGPQASTAAPNAAPTSQNARGAAADIRHPVDNGAAATGTRGYGPASEQRYDERTQAAPAATTAPPHFPIAENGPGGQRDTDIRQQGNGFTSSDRDKAQETRTTAGTSDPVNVAAGQERPFGTAPQA